MLSTHRHSMRNWEHNLIILLVSISNYQCSWNFLGLFLLIFNEEFPVVETWVRFGLLDVQSFLTWALWLLETVYIGLNLRRFFANLISDFLGEGCCWWIHVFLDFVFSDLDNLFWLLRLLIWTIIFCYYLTWITCLQIKWGVLDNLLKVLDSTPLWIRTALVILSKIIDITLHISHIFQESLKERFCSFHSFLA